MQKAAEVAFVRLHMCLAAGHRCQKDIAKQGKKGQKHADFAGFDPAQNPENTGLGAGCAM